MNEEFRKFVEQMDAEEKRKNGPRQFGRDHGTFLQVKTETGYEAYQVNTEKLLRWIDAHPHLNLGLDRNQMRVIDFRPTKQR